MTIMTTRPLGRTEFQASILGIGDRADRAVPLETRVATLRRALDAGLNVVDTAPGYEDGYSEQIVGAALGGRRDGVFVIDEILKELEPYTGRFPMTAMRAAIEQREAITPELLQVLDTAAENPLEFARRQDYMLHMFAMYLLAQFRETRAYRPLVRIFSAPGETPFDLAGDTVTEALNRILASVYDGDPIPLDCQRHRRDGVVARVPQGRDLASASSRDRDSRKGPQQTEPRCGAPSEAGAERPVSLRQWSEVQEVLWKELRRIVPPPVKAADGVRTRGACRQAGILSPSVSKWSSASALPLASSTG